MSFPNTPSSRHLAAVWFADIVGYTRLSAEDEAAALRLVEVLQVTARQEIEYFRGRLVKFVGDAVLAEFTSTDVAVRAAVALQREFAFRSASVGTPSSLRIGVHVGDVAGAPDGDIYGDGVNIASRLQEQADPGQVLVSEYVWHQLSARHDFHFQPLAKRELKGITARVAVFSVDVLTPQGVVRTEPLSTDSSLSPIALEPSPGADPPASKTTADGSIRSIAVLPFADVSPLKDQEYLSDGLTEELLHVLARLDGLKVPARTSSFAFKGMNPDVREVGRRLGVQAVVEGSIRRWENQIVVTAQLVSVADGYHLWSETYKRDLKNIFAIQEEIALAIVDAVRLRLPHRQSTALVREHTSSTEAHQLYLRGRFLWNKRTREGIQQATLCFRHAVEHDPLYAVAYVGLADAYALLGDYNYARPREVIPRAREAVLRALEIDDSLAEAHTSLAMILHDFDWDFAGSEREYRRAIALDPKYETARHWYGEYLSLMGRFDEGIQELRLALDLDPLSLSTRTDLARAYYLAGQYEEACEQVKITLELDSRFYPAYRVLGLVYHQQGSAQDAVSALLRAVELSEREPGTLAALACAYTQHEPESARKLLDELMGMGDRDFVSSYDLATVFATLGEKDQAFASLQAGLEYRLFQMVHLRVDPLLEPLHADPRFRECLEKVGLE